MRQSLPSFSLLAILSLAACGGGSGDRPPRVLSLQPSAGGDDVDVELAILGENFRPKVSTDFARPQGSTLESRFTAKLEAVETGTLITLTEVSYVDAQRLTTHVPAGLSQGLYHLVLTDSSGAESRLSQAYRVVAPAETVERFEFEPIAEQTVGVPFRVAITALDSRNQIVTGFAGEVSVESSVGGAPTPAVLGPFTLGRFRGQVALDSLGADLQLTVRDALGHAGTSAVFAVVQGAPAQLVAISAPTDGVAGSCSSEVRVALRDSLGLSTVARGDLVLAIVGSAAADFGIFSDAACSQPLGAAMIADGEGELGYFVRTQRAGDWQLRAVPAGLPLAAHPLTVAPELPTRLAFLGGGGAAVQGACSSPLEVELQDAFANASPSSSAQVLTLESTPQGGLSFYEDESCDVAVPTLTLASGVARTRFHFRAAQPGTYQLSVRSSAMGLTSATRSETVSP